MLIIRDSYINNHEKIYGQKLTFEYICRTSYTFGN